MQPDGVLALLEKQDWRDIILRLTHHAIVRFRWYNWKTRLPRGNSPEDIALGAIEKVWDGTRDWDPDKYPDLLIHLKWIVNSEIRNLYDSLEHRKTARNPDQNSDDFAELESIESAHAHRHSLGAQALNPEEELIAAHDRTFKEALLSEFRDRAKEDEDLELLFLCFDDGIDKAETISRVTGWDIKKVYNLRRKLLRKAEKMGKDTRAKEE
jgi:hypothetical protein